MRRSIKAAVLFVCFSLCALGLVLSPKRNGPASSPETELVPVKNQQPPRASGLRV